MSSSNLKQFSISLDTSLIAELDSYAAAQSLSRAGAVRELLTYALADKKADIYSGPLADMISRITRSEIQAMRQVQEEVVEADRQVIIDTFSEILAASDASLLFLTSLIAQPGSDLDPEEVYLKYRLAGRLATRGYPYNDALELAEKEVTGDEASLDDAEAW